MESVVPVGKGVQWVAVLRAHRDIESGLFSHRHLLLQVLCLVNRKHSSVCRRGLEDGGRGRGGGGRDGVRRRGRDTSCPEDTDSLLLTSVMNRQCLSFHSLTADLSGVSFSTAWFGVVGVVEGDQDKG